MSHNVLLDKFSSTWPESLITQYKQLEFVFRNLRFFERLDQMLQAAKIVNFLPPLFFRVQGGV